MKMFPKFGKRVVGIQNCDGTWFEVNMLGVGDNDSFESILQKVAEVASENNPEAEYRELVKARRKLINLAKKVMPEEKYGDLERFEFDEAAALVRYLLFGSEDTQGDPKKKVAYAPKKKRNWITNLWLLVFCKRSQDTP